MNKCSYFNLQYSLQWITNCSTPEIARLKTLGIMNVPA
uniref:Uncharacterized protein n=1 Tax=Rhizophora mucronata TaxID=61149 RepID=A0A2P2PQL4_RHIMU